MRNHFNPPWVNLVLRVACAITILFCVVWQDAAAQQPAPDKIRVLCLTPPLPLIVAQSRGIFTKYGVEVEPVVESGSEALRRDLAAGKGDIAFIAIDNAVAMVEEAHVDVVIVSGGENSLNELIVQPEIKTIKDLRGKKLLVDAPNTAYALELKKILLMKGLLPEKDFHIDPIGSTPFRLKAMKENKANAGSILSPPFSVFAKHAGLASLGTVVKLLGADQDRGTFALRSWAREHSDLLARYLAAYIEGQRLLMMPSNKPKVVALMRKEPNVDDQIADEWYATVMQAGGYATDARFNLDGFKTNLKLRSEVEAGGNGTAPAAEKYLDLSYYQAALSKIK